jgi:ERCC4-type nuclease
MRIVIDTREKRPYIFENSIKKALLSGDYSLEGFENQIAIERKSLDDFISTILNSSLRFRRELTRLTAYEYAAVIVEGSIQDILNGEYKSKINPQSLLGLIASLMLEYPHIQFLFCHDRPHAYALVSALLHLMGERIKKNGTGN